MSNPPRKYLWLALLLLAAFAFGLIRLFTLRFETGDVYPPYSSLRSDPLGTRALFEGLNTLTPGSAQRQFQALDRIRLSKDTTLLICGLAPDMRRLQGGSWEKLLDHLAVDGGHLVLAFTDRAKAQDADGPEEKAKAPNDTEPRPFSEPEEAIEEPREKKAWEATLALGIDIATGRRQGPGQTVHLTRNAPDPWLPQVMPWHGAQFFELHHEQWQTLYFEVQEDQAVVVMRSWGRGTLVMASDSYLFSNEALRKERSPHMLAWLLPSGNTIFFDEFHHGITRQPGIAALARKYGLGRIFGVLVVLSLLLIWRQSAVFVPQVAEAETARADPAAEGHDTGQGLVNLMQHHISDQKLLQICFDTWQAGPAARRIPQERIAQARRELAKKSTTAHDPVSLYQRIGALLQQGKHL